MSDVSAGVEAFSAASAVPLAANYDFGRQRRVLDGNARRVTVGGVRGLAPWQERRAEELMDQTLDITLSQLAESCRLSVSHFVRAFRHSTGLSPHQWLIRRRVNKAMALLSEDNLSIADIALACGFSSQSHLNRAFAAQAGVPPGRWRRLHRASLD